MTRQEEVYSAYKLREFDELNTISKVKSIDELKKKTREFCFDMFIEAYYDVLFALYYDSEDFPVIPDDALLAADKPTDGKTFDVRLDEHYSEETESSEVNHEFVVTPAMLDVVRSESHRCYNEGQMNAAKRIATENDSVITKTWDATLDNVTRDTHIILHGTTVMLDEYFTSPSGDRAQAPGGFSTAGENANCRCILRFKEYKA